MNAEETRAVVMQVLHLAASAGDLATAVEQFVAPSAIVHMPSGEVGQGQQASGGFLAEAYEAFPDLVLTLEGLMVVGDLAAIPVRDGRDACRTVSWLRAQRKAGGPASLHRLAVRGRVDQRNLVLREPLCAARRDAGDADRS